MKKVDLQYAPAAESEEKMRARAEEILRQAFDGETVLCMVYARDGLMQVLPVNLSLGDTEGMLALLLDSIKQYREALDQPRTLQ